MICNALFPWNCLNRSDDDVDCLLQHGLSATLRVDFAMNVIILQMGPCMLCCNRQVVKISYWGMPLSQRVPRISDEWSPVALFGSCWYPFHCWLDKCHSTKKYSCLEDLTQMGLVRLVHLRPRIKPITFFTDSGIVCHIFHRTAVHCLSLHCTSI